MISKTPEAHDPLTPEEQAILVKTLLNFTDRERADFIAILDAEIARDRAIAAGRRRPPTDGLGKGPTQANLPRAPALDPSS